MRLVPVGAAHRLVKKTRNSGDTTTMAKSERDDGDAGAGQINLPAETTDLNRRNAALTATEVRESPLDTVMSVPASITVVLTSIASHLSQ
jgi:hypothetical protein